MIVSQLGVLIVISSSSNNMPITSTLMGCGYGWHVHVCALSYYVITNYDYYHH